MKKILFLSLLFTGCFQQEKENWELVKISLDSTNKTCFECSNGNYAIDNVQYIDNNKDSLIYIQLDEGCVVGLKDN